MKRDRYKIDAVYRNIKFSSSIEKYFFKKFGRFFEIKKIINFFLIDASMKNLSKLVKVPLVSCQKARDVDLDVRSKLFRQSVFNQRMRAYPAPVSRNWLTKRIAAPQHCSISKRAAH